MALNSNQKPFGFDMEEKFKKVGRTDTDKYAHTDTDTYTDTDTAIKETKKKRTYGLVKQSVFDKVTEYADAHGTSYNAIVCELLDKFLEEKGL